MIHAAQQLDCAYHCMSAINRTIIVVFMLSSACHWESYLWSSCPLIFLWWRSVKTLWSGTSFTSQG